MVVIRLFIVFLKVGLFTIGSGYSMLVLAQRSVKRINALI
jgi:chromate transport protein ChrA